jgi:hypothetical protein
LVNDRRDIFARVAVLLLAAVVLSVIACTRGAEYDEQYTSFVTSGTPRPVWPDSALRAADVAAIQHGHAGPMTVAADLRRTDVHPPLYFWTVAAWRWGVADGLVAIRLLSVLFALGALAVVGMVARRCDIPPATAMLLTLGCYGFAYTAAIARGFALAELLTLGALLAVLARRGWIAGVAVGAAVATNYLAVFVGAGIFLGAGRQSWRVAAGAVPGVALAGWFYLGQRGSRAGQFPPFEIVAAVMRLARYGAANLTGGLVLYVPPGARLWTGAALALGIVAVLVLAVRRPRWPLIAAAVAPPFGLLGLGLAFHTLPIELRYLSFATPFVALLVAGARLPRAVLAVVFAVQALSIGGLILRPETMQPARAIARAAIGRGVVLLPRGNDGVGVVGAFVAEVPADTALLIVAPDETATGIRRRLVPFRRVVLAGLAVDADSRAAVAAMATALDGSDWRVAGQGFDVTVYERRE